ncbi:class I SAM-dependent methyltransferase [Nitrincola sp.]|uniref:class I SAM-dependent methyltransferase n=1 Tax=Nitrincola sp. TaxID=1926584 RepID=UPI003A8CE1E9
MSTLENTQAYLQRHHGGDGALAAKRTLESHQRNHDAHFQAFWNQHVYLSSEAACHLADLGCGPGLFLKDLHQRYPKANLTGIECAPYMLNQMDELPDAIQIQVADLNLDLPELFAANSLDVALANRLIHELHQPVSLFRNLFRWLKPGGVFILVDMVRQPLKSYLTHELKGALVTDPALSDAWLHDTFQHYLEHNRYHSQDLCDLLMMCGFELLASEPIRHGRAVQIAVRKP